MRKKSQTRNRQVIKRAARERAKQPPSPWLKPYAALNEAGRRIGQAHPNAKLLDWEIDLLLALRDQGWTYTQLAEKFEIHKGHVAKVCKGVRRCQTPATWRAVKR